ncbi:MAG: Crp/Fnr family transcriptional regulator [Xanthobacteraceae bacterium]
MLGTLADPQAHQRTQQHQTVRSGELIASRQQASENVIVMCSGWGFRHLQVPDGRKQILRFLLPGDVVSTDLVFEDHFSCSVTALTDAQLTRLPREKIQARIAADKSFLMTVADICVAEHRNSEEMLAVLGQRSAEQRIAYLFLHLMKRISAHNVIRDQRYRFPLRQQHIADAVGLTAVHVNRVLGIFRDRGVVELSDGVLHVLNAVELQRVGSLN